MKQSPCSIDGCQMVARARSWCTTHYSRWRHHGNPHTVLPYSKPPNNTRPKQVRWEEKVAHCDHSTNGCCVWTGSVDSNGYGQLRTGNRGYIERASRLSWEFTNGPIPEGLFVLHTCDNPPCVRPEHLWLGTQSDNMLDASRKGRKNRPPGDLRNHIPRGEEMGAIVKLKEPDIRVIRARADSGEPFTIIAKDYPVGPSQIGLIAARKSWRHIS